MQSQPFNLFGGGSSSSNKDGENEEGRGNLFSGNNNEGNQGSGNNSSNGNGGINLFSGESSSTGNNNGSGLFSGSNTGGGLFTAGNSNSGGNLFGGNNNSSSSNNNNNNNNNNNSNSGNLFGNSSSGGNLFSGNSNSGASLFGNNSSGGANLFSTGNDDKKGGNLFAAGNDDKKGGNLFSTGKDDKKSGFSTGTDDKKGASLFPGNSKSGGSLFPSSGGISSNGIGTGGGMFSSSNTLRPINASFGDPPPLPQEPKDNSSKDPAATIELDMDVINGSDDQGEYGMRAEDDGLQREYHIEGGIFPTDGLEQWRAGNRTLKFQLNPVSNEGIAWVDISDRKVKKKQPAFEQDKKLYPTKVPRQVVSQDYAKLVEDAYTIELQMQEARQVIGGDQRSWELAARDYLVKLMDTLNNYNDSEDKLHSELVWDARNIVSCFNTVKFTPTDVHNITTEFLDWVANVSDGWNIEDTREVMQCSPVTSHPVYWALIDHLVIRGQDHTCEHTLRVSLGDHLPADVQECMEIVIQLFKSYPEDSSIYAFRQWHDSCLDAKYKAQEIEDTEFRIQICKMLEIMSGSFDAILDAAETWYEAVGAMLKYHDPTRSRLEEYFNKALENLPVDRTIFWEAGAAAVISNDLLDAISYIESLDLGVAATMAKFCEYRGLLDHYFAVAPNENMPQWLSVTHAQQCLGNSNIRLTKVGIEMLQNVGTQEALDCIAEVLPKIQWGNPQDIDWATSLAGELGLMQTVKQIHKATANEYFIVGHYYDAFVGLAAAEDIEGLSSRCWKLFENMVVSQELPKDEITLAALQENSDYDRYPLVRECMAPSAVLNGVLHSLSRDNLSAAAKYMVALFRFPHLLPKFQAILIAMIMPLMSRDRPRVFSSQELVEVMAALNKWEKNDDEDRHAGLALLEHSLALAPAPSSCAVYDWRGQFQAGSDGVSILNAVRIALAKEVSRAYLEGA